MIRARPGKARPFSEIVRRLHELDNDCAVFAQADGKGGYEAAHVIPFD
ncbi:hypothetical protein GGQ87_002726 [Brevundimonas alba]|uniref:Uncharacterized protein n=1 Tax=Brevundimonas alba TaxID=74314 RepID=A0A7X5YM14_9CAUL|nr:hypothetical protein [Brevundimonas alba]NJC42431.1 hypothetical protein [Brevundimonas alba]